MMTVWVTTRKTQTEYGVEVGGYTDLRAIRVNLQTDYSELDLQEYGETVNELIKLRCMTPPPVGKGDMLYLARPQPVGTFTVDGALYDDYGEGAYRVDSVRGGAFTNALRNPTTIAAKKVTA